MQKDPTVLDKVSGVYAEHPQLVKTLGSAALAIALAGILPADQATASLGKVSGFPPANRTSNTMFSAIDVPEVSQTLSGIIEWSPQVSLCPPVASQQNIEHQAASGN